MNLERNKERSSGQQHSSVRTAQALKELKRWLSVLERSCLFCQDLEDIFENFT